MYNCLCVSVVCCVWLVVGCCVFVVPCVCPVVFVFSVAFVCDGLLVVLVVVVYYD